MAALTEEQTMIRDQAKSWVTEQAPVRKFRELRDSGSQSGFSPDTWSAMVDMGWTGMIIPEQYGGSDLGYLTFGIVLEETGRQLTASPLFASALVGASAILAGGSEAQKQSVLPKIVDGSAIVTLAIDESPRHSPCNISLTAEKSGDGFKLSGTKCFVAEGGSATHFVVGARTSGNPGDTAGISVFLVAADAAGISRQPLKTADSRNYANLTFDGVEVDAESLRGKQGDGWQMLESTLDRARAGIAAEMLGTGSQAFDMTLEYFKTRVQFGQVIGSFQALGHRAAGLFSKMELARSCVEAALAGIDSESKDIPQLCSLAKCKAGEFLYNMSNELIQIHGGIGMTDEFDAGFYLKRARAVEAIYGNQAFHRDRYASLLNF
ncbi:MAG TPA: acyl-CoA dehydrogenase family protein [Pseudomonadales bacterium]|nr:acyl-CoA dehydrogenase family protein [Pseudomonadales bacterium]